MADYIDGAIEKMEIRIKHGKPVIKRTKASTKVLNHSTMQQRQQAKHASAKAHNPIADARVDLSKEVAKDLGHKIS